MEADAPADMVSARYLERLTAGDLRMLAGATGADAADLARRMGDASLFLAGVFPDHSATRLSSSLRRDRLRRVLRVSDRERI